MTPHGSTTDHADALRANLIALMKVTEEEEARQRRKIDAGPRAARQLPKQLHNRQA